MSAFKDKYLKYKIKYTNLSGGNPWDVSASKPVVSAPKPVVSAPEFGAASPPKPVATYLNESLHTLSDDQLDDISIKTIKIIKDLSTSKVVDTARLKEYVSQLEPIAEEIRKRRDSKSLKHLHTLTDDQLDDLSIRTIKTIKDISTSKDLDVLRLKEYVSYQELIAEEIKKRYDLKSTVKP